MRFPWPALVLLSMISAPALALDAGQRPSTSKDPSPNFNRIITKKIDLPDGPGGLVLGTKPLSELLPSLAEDGSMSFLPGKTIGRFQNGKYVATPSQVQSPAGGDLSTVDLRSADKIPDTFFGGSGNGSEFSFCPWTGCDVNRDINRAQAYIRGKTKRDVLSAETLLALDTYTNTGFVDLWKVGTSYPANGLVSANGNIYRATVGGTSAASGAGPSGTGTGIVDGAVRWSYVQNANDTDAKTVLNITNAVGPNAGHTWTIASNTIMLPGVRSQSVYGAEWDMSNYAGDCTAATRNCALHLNYINGPFTNTALFLNSAASGVTPLSADNSSGGAVFQGMIFDGANLIRNNTIVDGTNSKVTLKGAPGTKHAQSFISDESNAPTSYQATGANTFAKISLGGTAPYGVYDEGTYTSAAYRYRNLLIGDWGVDKTYTAMTLNQTFGADLMGIFGRAGDSTLFVSGPGGGHVETRLGGATASIIDASQAKFFAPVTSTSLAGGGTRYACVNDSGTIFASATPCR